MKPFSFTKKERLLKRKDFIDVISKGKRFAAKNFTIFIKSNDMGIRRLGLSVSTKVGTAAERNRIKRLIREFFRRNKELFPASSDISISVRHGNFQAGYHDVACELTGFLKGLEKHD